MKPLTIEQLKSLEVGDWVWIKFEIDNPIDRRYAKQERYFQIIEPKNDTAIRFNNYVPMRYSDYGTKWIAYKNKEQAECNGATYCTMCEDDIFDAYVPVSSEGDICEKPAAPDEEWVYHANYCPNCGRRLISEEAERRLAELINR